MSLMWWCSIERKEDVRATVLMISWHWNDVNLSFKTLGSVILLWRHNWRRRSFWVPLHQWWCQWFYEVQQSIQLVTFENNVSILRQDVSRWIHCIIMAKELSHRNFLPWFSFKILHLVLQSPMAEERLWALHILIWSEGKTWHACRASDSRKVSPPAGSLLQAVIYIWTLHT